MIRTYLMISFLLLSTPLWGQVSVTDARECVILSEVKADGNITIFYSPSEALEKINKELQQIEVIKKEWAKKDKKQRIQDSYLQIEKAKTEEQKRLNNTTELKIQMMMEEIRAEFETLRKLATDGSIRSDQKQLDKINDLLASGDQIIQNNCLLEALDAQEITGKDGKTRLGFNRKDIEDLGYFLIGEKFSEGMAKVCRSNKCGFINAAGELVVNLKYDDVRAFKEGMAAVYNNKRWSFIDKNGKDLSVSYERVFDFGHLASSSDVTIVGDSSYNEYYLMNRAGKTISKGYGFPWYYLKSVDEGKYLIVSNTGKHSDYERRYGLINGQGLEILAPNCYDITSRSLGQTKEGVQLYKYWTGNRKAHQAGLFNSKGEIVSEAIYSDIGFFNDGLAGVQYEKKGKKDIYAKTFAKIINSRGQAIKVPKVLPKNGKFKRIEIINQELALGTVSGKNQILFHLNGKGKAIELSFGYGGLDSIQFKHTSIANIYKLSLFNQLNEKPNQYELLLRKLSNNQYETISNKVYFSIGPFNKNGIAVVRSAAHFSYRERKQIFYDKEPFLTDKWGMINLLDSFVTPIEYQYFSPIDPAGNRLGKSKFKSKFYFSIFNESAEAIVSYQDSIAPYSEGLYATTYKNKSGYLDPAGKTQIPFEYDEANSFKNGFAIVRQNNKVGLINRDGYKVFPCVLKAIQPLGDHTFKATFDRPFKGLDELVVKFNPKSGNCLSSNDIRGVYYNFLKEVSQDKK